jgi:hypothetical protein
MFSFTTFCDDPFTEERSVNNHDGPESKVASQLIAKFDSLHSHQDFFHHHEKNNSGVQVSHPMGITEQFK